MEMSVVYCRGDRALVFIDPTSGGIQYNHTL